MKVFTEEEFSFAIDRAILIRQLAERDFIGFEISKRVKLGYDLANTLIERAKKQKDPFPFLRRGMKAYLRAANSLERSIKNFLKEEPRRFMQELKDPPLDPSLRAQNFKIVTKVRAFDLFTHRRQFSLNAARAMYVEIRAEVDELKAAIVAESEKILS